MTDHQTLLDLIRHKLEARRDALQQAIEHQPVAASIRDPARDPGLRHLIRQREAVRRQLNEVSAVERISGGDLSHNNVAVANFIVSLTTLSEADRLEIATFATEL